jgi:hypothetical protein
MRKLLMVGLACTLPLGVGLSGSVHAAAATSGLGLTSFRQMVADNAAGYLFVSGDGEIVVTDATGAPVATLDAGDGVQGLAVSADGATLYAAITAGANANSVAAITVSTVTAATPTQAFYPLTATDAPAALAVQSGVLWVSYADSTATANPGGIGDFPLTADTPGTFAAATAAGTWAAAPDLAADPSDTGVLVAVLGTAAAATAATYTTGNVPAATTAAQAALGGTTACPQEAQVAVMPGGGQFTTACTTGQNAYVYSTADLSAGTPAYYPPAVNFPGSVAVDSGGTVAVGSVGNPAVIDVYKPDGTLLNSFDLGTVPLAAVNALAWLDTAAGPELAAFDQAPGGAIEVFAKPQASRATLQLATPTVSYLGRAITLHGDLSLSVGGTVPGASVTVTRTGPGGAVVLPPATVGAGGTFTVTNTPVAAGSYTYTAVYAGSASVITVSGKAAVTVKLNPAKIVLTGPASNALTKSLTIKGTLTLGVGGVMVGTKLPITRTGPGTTKKVFTVSTGKGGAFSLTDTPAALGTYTYAATFAGNAVTAKATASHLVTEVRLTPALSLASDGASVGYKSAVHLTAHLGATYSNRTVSIYARQAGSRFPTLVATGRVNSAGNLIASYTPTANTTFSAVFAGDPRYAMRTVTHQVGVGALVAMQLSGYYGTTKQGGQTYLLYHQSSQLNVAVTVTPNKHGQCVDLEAQEFYQGSWYPTLHGSCITLNTTSQLVGYLTLGQSDLGYPYRIRADYLSTTSTNTSTDSPWQYFMIEP